MSRAPCRARVTLSRAKGPYASSCPLRSYQGDSRAIFPVEMCSMFKPVQKKFCYLRGAAPLPILAFESSTDHLDSSWRDQSRVSPLPQRRRGVPCRRSIRDSAGPAALALTNQTAANRLGIEAGAPEARPCNAPVDGRRRKKNGEANPRLRVISALGGP